jgi:Icc-related predicted phosphoesterase
MFTRIFWQSSNRGEIRRKVKALISSDLHGNHTAYRWLAGLSAARQVDLMILAGDLLGCPDGYDTVEAAQSQDAAAIVAILKSARIPIYYIMGNDDLVELKPPSDQFISLHGQRVEIGFEKSEEEMQDDLSGLCNLVDTRTILVTHSPAYGILDQAFLDIHAGSRSILELVDRRQVYAHIHGLSTAVSAALAAISMWPQAGCPGRWSSI